MNIDDDRRPLEEWEEEPALDVPEPSKPSTFHLPVEERTDKPGRPPLTVADDPVFTQPATVEVMEAPTPPAPKLEGPLVFDAQQEHAIAQCGVELYTNISGTAGVGKTLVAQEIIKRHRGVVLCATTGIASINLGEGTTINSALKYFDTASLREAYRDGYLKSRIQRLRRSGVRRILIDEKSMMNGEQLTMITRAVHEVNEGKVEELEDVGMGVQQIEEDGRVATLDKDLPPIGVILVGDFGQLPPVADTDPHTGKKLPLEYAFDSAEWKVYAEHTTTLTTIYRQDAKDFVNALHAIRRGDVATALHFFTADRFSRHLDENYEGSTIFAKNASVDRHNLMKLDQLPGVPLEATPARVGKQRGDWKQIPDVLRLKPGALVMILANRREYDDEYDSNGHLVYCNGDLGTLQEPTQGGWAVTLKRTGSTIVVYPIVREHTIPLEVGRRKEMREAFVAGNGPDPSSLITDKGTGRSEIIGTITYMPLRAAYGCTVHKTQGLTLDRVQVNIRDPFFRYPSMLFVALSRARTAEGLRIVGDQRGFIERCRIEPRVQPWL